MTEIAEIVPGLWVFHDEQTQANRMVALRENAALVITPGADAIGGHSDILPFLEERGFKWGFALFLENVPNAPEAGLSGRYFHSESTDPSAWHEPARDNIKERGSVDTRPLPLPGWEMRFITLSNPGNPVVYNSPERILFSSPMLSDIDVPMLSSRGSAEYLGALERVEKLDPRLIVPGKGASAQGKREIRARIERDRNYVNALRRHVETSLLSHVTLERALEAARSIYGDYPFVETHLENLRWVWSELEAPE